MRQERHLPHDHGARPQEKPISLGAGHVRRRGSPQGRTVAPARDPRQRDRDDLPGPDDVAQSRAQRSASSSSRRSCSTTTSRRAGEGTRDRGAEGGRNPARGAPVRRLSAPVLGRHAAAGHDRYGAAQLSRPADRRRADDCARRHDAGPDPEADERSAGAVRKRHHHDHPRSRRRRRDGRRRASSCTPARSGAGARHLVVRGASASVHLGSARLPAAARRGSRASGPDSRSAAVAAASSERLQVPPAVRSTRWTCVATAEPELLPAESHPDHRFRCWLDQADPRPGGLEGASGRSSRRWWPRDGERADGDRGDGSEQRERAARRRGPEEALPGDTWDRLPEADRRREGRGRGQPHRPKGRDVRGCRRVRVRQVDDGPLRHAAARSDGRQDRSSRAATSRRSRVPRCGRSAAT